MPKIVKTPGVCGGSARIYDTRVPVWLVESYLRSGMSLALMLRIWPSLTTEDIDAAHEYALQHTDEIDAEIRGNGSA